MYIVFDGERVRLEEYSYTLGDFIGATIFHANRDIVYVNVYVNRKPIMTLGLRRGSFVLLDKPFRIKVRSKSIGDSLAVYVGDEVGEEV